MALRRSRQPASGAQSADGLEADGTGANHATGSGVVKWLLARGSPTYIGLVLAISIAKYGIGISPSWNYLLAIAQNWTKPQVSPLLQPPADFRLGSPTSAVLSGMLHLRTGPTFLAFHLCLACAAIALPFLMRTVRESASMRLTVAVLLVGGSVPAVLLDWVGSYDPVTLAAASVAGLSRSRVAAGCGWALFAFNNAPQAALALAVFVIVLTVDAGRAAWPRVVSAGAGAVAGYIGIRLLMSAWGAGTSRFTVFHFYPFSEFTRSAADFWPLIIFSGLGIGWVFLMSRDVVRLRAAIALLGLGVVACFTVPLVALDESRILAGVLWPSVLSVAGMAVARIDHERIVDLARRMLPLAAIVPVVLVWSDNLVYAGWRSLGLFFGYIFGHTAIPISA